MLLVAGCRNQLDINDSHFLYFKEAVFLFVQLFEEGPTPDVRKDGVIQIHMNDMEKKIKASLSCKTISFQDFHFPV